MAFVLVCGMRSQGFNSSTVLIWREGVPTLLVVGMYLYFAIAVILGLVLNRGRMDKLLHIFYHAGRAVAEVGGCCAGYLGRGYFCGGPCSHCRAVWRDTGDAGRYVSFSNRDVYVRNVWRSEPLQQWFQCRVGGYFHGAFVGKLYQAFSG